MISNSSSELKKGKRVRKKGGDDGSGGWPHISYKPDLTVTPLKSNLLFTVNINFRNPVYLGFLTDRSIDRLNVLASTTYNSCSFQLQVPNFLTTFESKRFVEAAESLGFAHQGSLGPTRGEAFRDNDRISVNHPVLAEAIWESGLKNIFSDVHVQKRRAVGLNPNIRFYRYVMIFSSSPANKIDENWYCLLFQISCWAEIWSPHR